MMFKNILALFAISLITAPVHANDENAITTEEAISLAAKVAPKAAIVGVFEVPIKAIGEQDGRWFLNSELDYRDQRNLTIAVQPDALKDLRKKVTRGDLEELIGKTLTLTGPAMRVKIGFRSNGRLTDKYYYQTHLQLRDIRQIQRIK